MLRILETMTLVRCRLGATMCVKTVNSGVVLIGLCLGACLSPTLPLPPPDAPENIGLSDDGVWEVRGLVTPGATVLVKNLATGQIVGAEDQDADGRYFIRVPGEMCDAAEVTELFDSTTTAETFFILETTVNSQTQGDCE